MVPTIFTPGSTAGTPINIVGSLAPPSGLEGEARHDEIEGFVSGLLGLVGVDADPLASREHILLANLVDRAWSEGRAIELGQLVAEVQSPPLRKLGVIELDAFFPIDDRRQLAQRLNGLLASPAFSPWMAGPAFELDQLLAAGGDGRVPVLVVELAHLSDEARQMALTLVTAKIITWMRRQPGTDDLRLLVYLDEAFGFLPPVAAPASKKPILTILKQARAFGVGMVIATQNPVDLDYKALSNAGTWLVGRLQTERDKQRLLDGMQSVAGDTDLGALGATISGLGKREFVYHSAKGGSPTVFTSRWAMSYLPGPLTLPQIRQLSERVDPAAGSRPEAGSPAPVTGPPTEADAETEAAVAAGVPPPTTDTSSAPLADDEVPVMPEVAPGIPVYHFDAAAPWGSVVGAVPNGRRLEAALAARVQIRFDDRAAELETTEEWEAVFCPLTEPFTAAAAHAVDHDERDFVAVAPEGARYVLPLVPLGSGKWFQVAGSAIRDQLVCTEAVTVYRNRPLKLFSRTGERLDDFAARCHAAAEVEEDREADALRRKLAVRIDRVRAAIESAQDRAQTAEADQQASLGETLAEGAGSLLDVFLRGRRGARSMATSLRRGMARRSQASRSAERAAAAERKVLEKVDELHDLEQELATVLVELDERWRAEAELIEEVHVAAEKTDISVPQLAVVWIPRASLNSTSNSTAIAASSRQ